MYISCKVLFSQNYAHYWLWAFFSFFIRKKQPFMFSISSALFLADNSFYVFLEKNKNKSELLKQKFFIDDWLSEPVFKTWLVKEKDNTWPQCSVFHKTIELSSSGCTALTDHAKEKKHAVKKISTFFTPVKKTVW